jgi:predicted RND superfamily exporter protein
MRQEGRGAVPRRLVLIGLRHPRWTLACWAAAMVAAVPFVLQLSIETSTESVLDRSDPAWAFYERSQEIFGSDEFVAVMLESEQPFDPLVLRRIVDLTKEIERIPDVRRVDSLASVPLVEARPDGSLSLDAALGDGVPSSDEALDALARRVLSDRLAPRVLVSDDGRAFAVNIVLERDVGDRYPEILAAIDEAIGDPSVVRSGVPVTRLEVGQRTQDNLLRFVPFTVAGIVLLVFVLFGSARVAVTPLVCSGAASWIMLGVMGAMERPLTITTAILPSLLLAMGCAYGIHLLTAASGEEAGRNERMLQAAPAIALSGLTTTIGFLAIALVEIDAIHDIGRFGALGVLLVLAATLTAGPAALTLWSLRIRQMRLQTWLAEDVSPGIVALVERHRRLGVVAWLGAAVAVGAGLVFLRVESDVVLWFPHGDPIRDAYEAIRAELSGISPMNVVVEAPEGSRITDPGVLDALDRLARHLEQLPEVGKAISITDPLTQIHEGFLGDRDAGLPHGHALIEQYLLLLESKPQINDLVTSDRRLANVVLRLDDNGSDALLRVARTAEAWWAHNGPAPYQVRTTGIMYEFARAQHEITMGQLRGLLFALVTISVILLAVFRSVRLALIGLVPNIVPIVMIFGVMGLASIPLDAATVVLGSLAFGIAVDDTIHTLVGFERHQRGAFSDAAALAATYRDILPALVFTSVVVALGFGVLGLSEFSPTRRLGLLTAIAMVLCLLADVLLLPALLVGKGKTAKNELLQRPRDDARQRSA